MSAVVPPAGDVTAAGMAKWAVPAAIVLALVIVAVCIYRAKKAEVAEPAKGE